MFPKTHAQLKIPKKLKNNNKLNFLSNNVQWQTKQNVNKNCKAIQYRKIHNLF